MHQGDFATLLLDDRLGELPQLGMFAHRQELSRTSNRFLMMGDHLGQKVQLAGDCAHRHAHAGLRAGAVVLHVTALGLDDAQEQADETQG